MRPVALLLCLIALAGLPAVTVEQASLRGFLYGFEPNCAYGNWVSHISEGRVSNLNVYAPWEQQNNDFGDFYIPDEVELNHWDSVIVDFLELDLAGAENKIQQYGFPYEVVSFQDLDSGRHVYMLRELLNNDIDDNGTADTWDDETGSFDYGWGLYLYDPNASRPIIISAPHPCDDYPSPVFALEAFQKLDARFLMISGAGREVAYQYPYWSNNQSISDPSRYDEHPFNYAYRRFADQIRGLTGKLEFSLQIHTYDWNKYPGETNVMLSAGNGRQYCALPIRDNSRGRHDLVHATPFVVHPAGTIGSNLQVDISQYYSIYYHYNDPVFYVKDGHNFQMPYQNTLPGSQTNQQMLYTVPQNTYDVVSPFLHVEMDELPGCYEQESSRWRWFYAYDEQSGIWDPVQRYDLFLQYYTPWLDALLSVLDAMLELNDHTGPSDPENLRVTSITTNYIDLAWDRSYSYDFDSYVIDYRYEENGSWTHVLLDRNTNPALGWQNRSYYDLNLGSQNRIYYFRLRARDKQGNYSNYTTEIKVWKHGTVASEFTATPYEHSVSLNISSSLSTILGFNVYRAIGNGPFTQIAYWTQDPGLYYNVGGQYSFTDHDVSIGTVYRYQVSAQYQGDTENFHWSVLNAAPYKALSLQLSATNYPASDSLQIGVNPLSADALDAYDLEWTGGGQYLNLVSVMDDETMLKRDIRASFDRETGFKTWNLSYRCNLVGLQLSLEASPQLLEEGWDLVIYDADNEQWHDLRNGAYLWQSPDTGWHPLYLSWGYQLPFVVFESLGGTFFHHGQPIEVGWQMVNAARVSEMNLYAVADGDTASIAMDLNTQLTQYEWLPAMPLHDARLLMELVCYDRRRVQCLSPQSFNLVPQQMIYQQSAGYALIAIPLTGFSQSVQTLLGAGVQAFIHQNGVWQSVQQLEGGNAYLISSAQPWTLTLPSELPSDSCAVVLQNGWNYVHNPQWKRYWLKDLLFTHNGETKSQAQMVSEGIIPPYAYSLSQSGWQLTTELLPQQGFALFCQNPGDCAVVFDPYYSSGIEVTDDTRLRVSLSVSDGYASGDAVQLGCADSCSEALDPLLDLSKPTGFPGQPWRLSLLAPESDAELQSEFRGLFPWYNQVEKTWPLKLQLNTLQPVRIALEATDLPDDYTVVLSLNGEDTMLTPQISYWFTPSYLGTYHAAVKVRNYTQRAIFAPTDSPPGIVAWPNPFKDRICMNLSLSGVEPLSAVIYNLRGQRVATLFKGKPTGAKLSLTWDGLDGKGQKAAAGVYLLRVSQAGETQNLKLIKY